MMAKNSFIRFAEMFKTKKEMRVVSITGRLMIAECTGTIHFTDLQFQEGDRLTGYTVHTSKMLARFRENGEPVPPRHYKGVVRTSETVISFNLGKHPLASTAIFIPCQTWRQAVLSFPRAWAGTK